MKLPRFVTQRIEAQPEDILGNLRKKLKVILQAIQGRIEREDLKAISWKQNLTNIQDNHHLKSIFREFSQGMLVEMLDIPSRINDILVKIRRGIGWIRWSITGRENEKPKWFHVCLDFLTNQATI
jgi:hypothetical protein